MSNTIRIFPDISVLLFPLGTPGDFLAWFRERITSEGQNGQNI
ncbi:MAG TPA: hypothetical protein VJ183_16085 [Chloroflexia bacterium]|nr:hypothetical protein [Chloroflexia bacterium]